MNIFGNLFKKTLFAIFIFEAFSLLGHFIPLFNILGFSLAIGTLLFLGLRDFKYAFYFLFVEIFIGSFGRLFSLDIFGFSFSLRMGIWLAIMTLWLLFIIRDVFSKEKESLRVFIESIFRIKYFIPLFIFIVWGIINAMLSGNNPVDIFNDANAYVFFLLIFPALYAFRSKKELDDLIRIFFAACLWLSFKTFVLFFIFSHNMQFWMSESYTWVRDTRIGEITTMDGSFVRIFFQSHIFVGAALIFILILIADYAKKQRKTKSIILKKEFVIYFSLLSLFTAVNILNLSRSNWVGLVAALFAAFIFIFWTYGFKKTFLTFLISIASFVSASIFIILLINFPYPNSEQSIDAGSIIKERGSEIKNEAGASSRFSLLPVLWTEIKEAPILGKGFGASVTYKSSDPRILEKDPEGLYTTFAFEWGWLDLWLKMGIFGLMAYLMLLFYFAFLFFKKKKKLSIAQTSFFIALIFIFAVSFFSPYLNHPLGITYIVFLSLFYRE